MSSSSEDEELVVVIDGGSGSFKVGFAGDDAPRLLLSSVVGIPKCTQGNYPVYGRMSDFYIGDEAQAKRDLLSLHYPIERGIVTDWDILEKIVDYSFKQLKVDPSQICLLMSEPPLNLMANREKMAQKMFETFNVKGFFMMSSSTLAIFAYGRSAGLMIDIGDGITSVTAEFEVFSVPNAIQKQDFAGRDLTQVFQKLLYQKGICFSTPSELEGLCEIKEELCNTQLNIKEDTTYLTPRSNSFALPDGKIIKLTDEQWMCGEALFDPCTYTGQNLRGLHELVRDCFANMDIDLRNNFYCNMLLTGGTSCLLGLPERLEIEMKKMLPARKVTRVVAAPERKYSVWIGGSIQGSLTTFQSHFMTKKNYEEFGPSFVHRKFV